MNASLFVYELATQIIIWLGLLRQWIVRRQLVIRKDRVFDIYEHEYDVCCDCGLSHKRTFLKPGEDCGHVPVFGHVTVGHAFPERPAGYAYKPRHGAGKPSLAVPKDGHLNSKSPHATKKRST